MKNLLTILLLALSITTLHAKTFTDEIEKIVGSGPEVNINLGTGIINTILALSDDEDAKKVNNLISGLDKLKVSVFELSNKKNSEKLSKLIQSKIDSLVSKGYEQIVTVKEKNETVHIVAKVNGDKLEDAMVIVMEENDELVVIDMKGILDLKQLAKLTDKFDVNLNNIAVDS